ncbi:MAG: GAF domain-containing protein [Coriobacteriia bacterium]|nr:GAF domain-containing protein [Coriobacteriia bacterium]
MSGSRPSRKRSRARDRLSSCPIVGVGASAGGLDAFRRLLGAVRAESPFSFVLVQHLDPDRPTHLVDLLADVIALPVRFAEDGLAPASGNVYIIPEGRLATMEEGVFHLRSRDDECAVQPIDTFFTSLALHEQSGACAVLLSGMGSDGVQGLREVAAAGGLTFVQLPDTAEFDPMPRAAIAARAADFVGSPEEIAEQLHARSAHPHLRDVMEQAEDERAFTEVLTLVLREAGMDFSQYKPSTVRRRMGRRAMLRNVESLEAYLDVLRAEPAELDALVRDLLINVTQFFRDPEVFELLRERVFPEVLRAKASGDAVRVWVPGCSTGEEVYSILITLLEALDEAEAEPKVTVFGTDASETAIRAAREGVYPDSICASVSPERAARFFERVEGGLRVVRPLREMCIFARQDITRDTPFSRLDLVSMRNLLIYFEPALQKKVLAIAHFALAPQGFLVLGTSETPDSQRGLFSSFDKQRHVYRRKDVPPHLPIDVMSPLRVSLDALSAAEAIGERPPGLDVVAEADELTLAAFGPPRAVVDAEGHILHFFGDTAPFMTLAEGRATLDLLQMARLELALEVKDAFEAARETNAPARREASFTVEGRQRRVAIQVLPLASVAGSTHFLVAFLELPPTAAGMEPAEVGAEIANLYEAREERLRRELAALRARTRSISEEKDNANHALRAANEEVRSSNEELQSINEELETAKEELQSANEELSTVNEELRNRNSDLARLNDDLTNFAASTDIPVVMVDSELRVRRFTSQAVRVMHVASSDEGRLLHHLRMRVDMPDMEQVVRRVIQGGFPETREIRDDAGRWYSLRILPYRSSAGNVKGAVLGFIDVDELRRSLDRVEYRARLAAALNDIDADISSKLQFDEIMRHALDDGVRALGMDVGAIEIRDGGEWVVRYQNGLRSKDVGRRLADSEAPVAARTARTREPVAVGDIAADDEVNAGYLRSREIRAVLAAPLVVRADVTGCILLLSTRGPRRFNAAEVDFIRRLAASVSLALENARLLEDERRAARTARALNKVNEILMAALTPDDVLARLVGEVSEVAGADKCLVIGIAGDTFTVTHARNVADGLLGRSKPASFFPAFALAARERRPVLIEDNWSDPRTNKDFVVPYELRAFQLMPLRVGEEVVGVLAFAYDAPRRFHAEDARFCEQMARAMSLALTNARLYEAVRESEAKYRYLFTNLIDGFALHEVVLDEDGEPVDYIFLEVNEAFEKLTGLKAADIAGKRVTEVMPGIADDPADWIGTYGRVALTGEPIRFERYSQALDKWYSVSVYRPEERRFVTVFDDITERKRAEEALADTTVRIRLLAESARLLLMTEAPESMVQAIAEEVMRSLDCDVFFNYVIEDGDGRLHLNAYAGVPEEVAEEIAYLDLGVGVCGCVAKDGVRIVAEDVQNSQDERTELVRSLGVQAYACHPLVHHGKTIGTLSFGSRDRTSLGNEELGLMRVVADQTATAMSRKKAEDRLREAQKELRGAVEDLNRAQAVAKVGSWRLDTRRDELTWSEETHRMFGIPLGTPMTYEKFLSTVHPEDRQLVDERWEAALKGEPYDVEHRIVVGGAVKWVREQAELELDEAGELLGGFGTVQDVTERKDAEAQREEYLFRLVTLLEVSTDVLAAGDTEDMLRRVADAARQLVGARLAVAGHGYEQDDFRLGVVSRAEDAPPCMEGAEFAVERGGTYLELVESVESLRLTEERLRAHPRWRGLPEGHVPLRGLLGARLSDTEGRPVGMIMLSDKEGDFTPEDEVLLRQLASIASLGLQHIESRNEAESERSRLRTIIDTIPIGFSLLGPDGAVLDINEATNRIWAGELPKAADIEGYRVYKGFHRDTGEPVLAHEWPAPRVVATGERVEEVIDIERFDGSRATVRVDAIPLADDAGRVGQIVVVTEDVTEQVRRQELNEELNGLQAAMSATLDTGEILRAMIERARRAVRAECGCVAVRRPDGWVVHAVSGDGGPAVGTVLGEEGVPVVELAVRERRPVAVGDVEKPPLGGSRPAEPPGLRSLMAVPLIAQGDVVGVAWFGHRGSPATFTDPETEFASRLADVVSLALDNALLYERERTIADTLQEAVLTPPEQAEGIEVSYLYRPASSTANVGGDLYDVFPIDADRVGIVIGDVSGKGLEAARLTSLVRDGIRAYSYQRPDPGEVLEQLNRLLYRSSPVEAFATVFLVVLDRHSGRLRYCGAAHPSGIVLGAERLEVLEESGAGPVGAFGETRYASSDSELIPGETLVLYTDGITEARRDGEMFGEDRLVTALDELRNAPLEDLPGRLLAEVLEFCGGSLRDDTVVMCVRWTGSKPDE